MTPAVCLHCKRERHIHGRGLCSTCYLRPEVRALFPARRPWATGRRPRPHGPKVRKPPRHRDQDGLVARLLGREYEHPAPPPEAPAPVFGPALLPPTPTHVELSDDTSPAAIAAAQCAAVREARAALGRRATVEDLSAAACLPVWTVTRRLAELTEGSAA